MSRLKFTYRLEDIELVQSLYSTTSAAELAAQIHGTPRAANAIYRLAFALGLCKCPHLPPQVYGSIRRLHADGLPDRVIALKLGMKRDSVKDIRRVRLGLPTIPDIDGKRQSVRTQLARLGLRQDELRSWGFRRYARRHGWPEDLRPREVQILNVLAARGPMTARELAEAIGMRTDQVNSTHGGPRLLGGNGPGGTYTASLMRRGLIVKIGRKQQGCDYQVVYSIALTAQRSFDEE